MAFYVEVTDKLKGGRAIISLDQLNSYILNANSKKTELYISYYNFDSDLVSHHSIRKTITNFSGTPYIREVLFDLDLGNSTKEFLLLRTREFVKNLNETFMIPYEGIKIAYSGRGFHISIPNIFRIKESPNTAVILKNTCLKYFPEADNIYDAHRIIRVENTINLKSNLYKKIIPLELFYSGLQTDIEKFCESLDVIEEFEFLPIEDYPDLSELCEDTALPSFRPQIKTSAITPCAQQMYNEGPTPGTRHNKLMRMISVWMRAGVSPLALENTFVSWAPDMSRYEIKRLVQNQEEKQYLYSCNDPLLMEYCDSKCIHYKHKNLVTKISTPEDAHKSYQDFLASDFAKSGFNLADLYYCSDFKFYPGEVCSIMGDTKLGKSTILQNWLAALTNHRVLYVTLENHLHLAHRRFLQIAHGLTVDEVNTKMLDPHTDQEAFKAPLQHIKYISTQIDVKELKRVVAEYQPTIVAIDTLDSLKHGNIVDITVKTQELADELKAIANQFSCIIITVVHINKSSAEDEMGRPRRLTIHSNKGSTNVPQKFDKIIAFEGIRNQKERYLKSLGARDEHPVHITLIYDTDTFRMNQFLPRQTEIP